MNPQIHINELFADSVFQEIRRKRFGIKSCKARVDPDLADDLRIMYQRNQERAACGETCNTCPPNTLEEKINTL